MEILLIPICGIGLLGLFASTFWLSLNFGQPPKTAIGRVVFSNYWALVLLILLPMYLGEFARHEVSPLPWRACLVAFARHGFIDASFELTAVVIVDLWIFVVPACLYAQAVSGISARERTLAYFLNFVLGLLLVTPANPIYKFISFFHADSGDSM